MKLLYVKFKSISKIVRSLVIVSTPLLATSCGVEKASAQSGSGNQEILIFEGQSYGVSDWSWGVSQSGTTHLGGGGGAGKVNVGDLFITFPSEELAVDLLEFAATGRHIEELTLSYGNVQMILIEALVTGLNVGSDGQSAQINFSQYSYIAGGKTACWQIPTNTPC